jgi:hypothetical protein
MTRDPGPEPSKTCPQHRDEPSPHPCGACGDHRGRWVDWNNDKRLWTSEQASTAARRKAELRRLDITQCAMCDDDGYHGGLPCSHDPLAANRARTGIAACREALDG